MNQKTESNESIQIPESPEEILKSHTFSPEELYNYFKKLSYSNQDIFISNLISYMIRFHEFLISKSESDSELNRDILIEDLTKYQIIQNLHNSI